MPTIIFCLILLAGLLVIALAVGMVRRFPHQDRLPTDFTPLNKYTGERRGKALSNVDYWRNR